MDESRPKTISYRDAGVDIDRGAELVERIKPAVRRTHRAGVASALGGFGGLFALGECGYSDPVLVSATDGVGTKLKFAIESGHHGTVGIDLVAMCVNDIVVQGAEPLFFLDYFASSTLDVAVAEEVISGIAHGCEMAGAALLGGETAEMPDMYRADDYDIAGFCVGAVERDKILEPRMVQVGDKILGLASSGLHANGYSLVRHIVDAHDILLEAPFNGKTLAEELLTPTRIYVKPLLQALAMHEVHGLAHITGGGITENVPRVLPPGLCAAIDLSAWDLPPIFNWLVDKGPVEHHELLRTFNCGIGMVVIAPPAHANAIISTLQNLGETTTEIGEIILSDTPPQVHYSGVL